MNLDRRTGIGRRTGDLANGHSMGTDSTLDLVFADEHGRDVKFHLLCAGIVLVKTVPLPTFANH